MSKELSVDVKDEAFTREVHIVWTDFPEVPEIVENVENIVVVENCRRCTER